MQAAVVVAVIALLQAVALAAGDLALYGIQPLMLVKTVLAVAVAVATMTTFLAPEAALAS
jgi:hypothetical protein